MRPILYLIVAGEEALVQCTIVPVPVVHNDEADACPVISDRYFRDSVDLNADF